MDTNILFYEKNKDGGFNLLDIFTVNNGPEIVLDLGTWDKSHGLQLEMSIYRWDRRTDMNGAKFILNRIDFKSRDSRIKKIEKQLLYMANRLNLKLEPGYGNSKMRTEGHPEIWKSEGSGSSKKNAKKK